MENSTPTTPRRNRLDLNQPAELAIYNAMQEVEKMPASTILTDTVTLLSKAKDLVSDFIDGIEPKKEVKKTTYCIEVQRSGEEDCVLHHEFDKEPTRQDILDFLEEEDLGYDDDYGKFEYYPV